MEERKKEEEEKKWRRGRGGRKALSRCGFKTKAQTVGSTRSSELRAGPWDAHGLEIGIPQTVGCTRS